MQAIHHPATSRGHAAHGWLDTYHTFSFASYQDPERMRFGVLRVLNDDVVAPGHGFGSHPHDNMEIVSIPLEGDLEHRDNMGNVTVIRQGDIQVMSAGTGVVHSEKNRNRDRQVKFLQIWLFPRERNLNPRYGQYTMNTALEHNRFSQVLSPDPDAEGVWVNQDAYFSIGRLDSGAEVSYTLNRADNGVYLFVLEGQATVGGHHLQARDGLGITETDSIRVGGGAAGARVLLMEVPMQ